MDNWMWIAAGAGVLVLFLVVFLWVKIRRTKKLLREMTEAVMALEQPARKEALPELEEPTVEAPPLEEVPHEVTPAAERDLTQRLGRTRGTLFGRLGKYFGYTSAKQILAEQWDEIEEVLLE